jgi:hypothetical protein
MRIETTIQEMRPKDKSDQSKKRVRKERDSTKLISVGNNAPVKHVVDLIQKYGITMQEITKAMGQS